MGVGVGGARVGVGDAEVGLGDGAGVLHAASPTSMANRTSGARILNFIISSLQFLIERNDLAKALFKWV